MAAPIAMIDAAIVVFRFKRAQRGATLRREWLITEFDG
jgi:hypothetical protein